MLVEPRAEQFHIAALRELARAQIPFLLAGTYAISAYTGIIRPTKDLDIFCTPDDCPRILDRFETRGFRTAIEDKRWLAKVCKGKYFFDVIFASSNGAVPITNEWFRHARQSEVLGTLVRLVGPTELIWSKVFIQTRDRSDGADVAHVILKQHRAVDWRRLLRYMDPHWELLLTHLLNYRWAYPSERNAVPRWLMAELIGRLQNQLDEPPTTTKICRGRLLSASDYEIDVREWGFATPVNGSHKTDEA